MKFEFDKILKTVMPRGKIKHSKRVANALGNTPDHVKDAALFHDFIERGGDINVLKSKLDPRSVKLIELATIDDGSVLKHMKKVLREVEEPEFRNFLILLKIADRKDNYNKRVRKGTLSQKYKRKTNKLLQYLKTEYTGPKSLMHSVFKK